MSLKSIWQGPINNDVLFIQKSINIITPIWEELLGPMPYYIILEGNSQANPWYVMIHKHTPSLVLDMNKKKMKNIFWVSKKNLQPEKLTLGLGRFITALIHDPIHFYQAGVLIKKGLQRFFLQDRYNYWTEGLATIITLFVLVRLFNNALENRLLSSGQWSYGSYQETVLSLLKKRQYANFLACGFIDIMSHAQKELTKAGYLAESAPIPLPFNVPKSFLDKLSNGPSPDLWQNNQKQLLRSRIQKKLPTLVRNKGELVYSNMHYWLGLYLFSVLIHKRNLSFQELIATPISNRELISMVC